METFKSTTSNEDKSLKGHRKSERSRERDTDKTGHSRQYNETTKRVECDGYETEDSLRRNERDRKRDKKEKSSSPGKASSLESGEVTPSPKKTRNLTPIRTKESERSSSSYSGKERSKSERTSRRSHDYAEEDESTKTSTKKRTTRRAAESSDDEDVYRDKTRRRERREKDRDRDRYDDEDGRSNRIRPIEVRDMGRDRRRKERDRVEVRQESTVYDRDKRKRKYASESPSPEHPKRREKDRDRSRKERDRSNDSRTKDRDEFKGKRKYESANLSPDPPRKHTRKKTRQESPEPEGSIATASSRTKTTEGDDLPRETRQGTESSVLARIRRSATGKTSVTDLINGLAFVEAMESNPSQPLTHTDTLARPADQPIAIVKETRPVMKIIIKMPKSPEKRQLLPNPFSQMKPRPARKEKDRAASGTENLRTEVAESSLSIFSSKPLRRDETTEYLPIHTNERLVPRRPSISSRESLRSDPQARLEPPLHIEESPPSSRAEAHIYIEPPSSTHPIVYTLPADGEVSKYAEEYVRCGCAIEGILQCTRCKIMRSSDRIINRIKAQRMKWAAEAKASGDRGNGNDLEEYFET